MSVLPGNDAMSKGPLSFKIHGMDCPGEFAVLERELGNGDGALEIRSTKPAGDTTLAHVIRMVGEAQAKRSPSEQWVEKFAKEYTPVLFGLALTILVLVVVPPFFLHGSWPDWIYRSLLLLAHP